MKNQDTDRKSAKPLARRKGHRLSEGETKPTRILECPPELGPAAQQEWDRLTRELIPLGILSSFDRGTLAVYCNSYAAFLEAVSMIQKHGEVIKSPNGHPMQSPYVSLANKHENTMIRLALEFGFTPASRARNFSYEKRNSMLLEQVEPSWKEASLEDLYPIDED